VVELGAMTILGGWPFCIGDFVGNSLVRYGFTVLN
jgi:hypothetical protein